MKQFLNLSKALSDSGRLRIIMALQQGELCVCQLLELLQLAPSTVSKHLSILYQAGLVDQRKDGRWVFYCLPATPDAEAAAALDWVRESLERDPAITEDRRLLRQILKIEPETLCQRQLQK